MHLLVGLLRLDETQVFIRKHILHPPKNCFLCFLTCAVGTESVNTAWSRGPPGYFELTVQERRLSISPAVAT